MMINRRNEISTYKIIGWSFNDIKRNYLQEISLWSSIALLLGGITSLILFAIFYPITVVNILMILMTIILIFTLIMITCYSLISWSLKHYISVQIFMTFLSPFFSELRKGLFMINEDPLNQR